MLGADSDESVEIIDKESDFVSKSGELLFSRVYVPSGRLSDIVRDENRYIPMAVGEFENAIQQIAPLGSSRTTDAPQPVVEHVLYELSLDKSGALIGNVSIWFQDRREGVEVSPGTASFQDIFWRNETSEVGSRVDWSQKKVEPERKSDLSEEGDVAVDFIGKPNGTIELWVPDAGRLFAKLRVTPTRSDRPPMQGASDSNGQSSFLFPRIPAMATTLVLDLPENVVPLIVGNEATTRKDPLHDVGSGELARWKYLIGPRQLLNVALSNHTNSRCSCWSTIFIGERNAEIETVVVPETVWFQRSTRLNVGKQATIISAQAWMLNASQISTRHVDVERNSDSTVNVILPVDLIGTSAKILVSGIITGVHQNDERLWLPGLAINQEQWVSGGFVIGVENNLQVSDVIIEDCIAIAPEESGGWPKAMDSKLQAAYREGSNQGEAGFVFEQQESNGSCMVSVTKRRPEFDVARVTTIDVSSASLIGRAACDIRVRRGNLHKITGRIGKQWFIDSVEPLVSTNTSVQPDGGAGNFVSGNLQSDVSKALGETYDWKVFRSKESDQFVLELPRAVQDGENLRLRITGHRRGVVAGGRIRSIDDDMIQLSGEASEQVWMDLRTSPETTLVEIGDAKDEPLFDPRLMLLVEGGVWRKRVAVGRLAAPREFRFLRRRPPLEVIAQSQLTVRGDQVGETYSFLCQAFQGELDAVTVHFSEPVGDLDWSILTDSQTTAIARRLNSYESPRIGETGSLQRSAKESWLVELNPPVTGSTTLRATGERDFTERTAIPLAWVESAVSPQGRISILSAHENRPSVLNHGLVQMPPLPGQLDLPIQTVMELRYDDTALAATGPAVEILPSLNSLQSVPRAWVWKESASVRCYTSGNAEYETVFIIENDGRQSVTVSLPEGHQLIGLDVQGESIPLQSSDVRECPVYLPSGRQKVSVAVQTTVAAKYSQGLWELSSAVPAVDAPTLTRELQVTLPKNVRLVGVPSGYKEVYQQKEDWIEKLFGISLRGSSFAIAGSKALRSGFDSRRFVPTSGRYESKPFLFIDRRLLALTSIGFAALTAAFSLFIFWRCAWLLVAAIVVASVAALWVPQPFDLIARASLWGILTAAGFRIWLYGYATKKTSFAVLLVTAFSACSYGDEIPMQVFFTPIEGETTALVPEPLYKVLAGAAGEVQQSRTRILNSRIEVPTATEVATQGDREVWYLNILVETDTAESLLLDQSLINGRFANEGFLLDGGTLSVSMPPDRSRAVISLPAGGRHSLVVPLEPVVTSRGDVSFCEVCLPNAPQTIVTVSPSKVMSSSRNESGGMQCEWATEGGVFQPAQNIASLDTSLQMFRVPAANRLRVIRSLDTKVTLAARIRQSESRNRISWTPTDILLMSEFTIDSGDSILPSFWIQADPRLSLEIGDGDDSVSRTISDFQVHSLGSGVYRVDQRLPVAGKTTCKLMFRLPSINLAGKFELPYAWILGIQQDARESMVVPPEGTSVDIQFPGAVAPPQISEIQDGSLQWFSERVGSAGRFSSSSQAKDVLSDTLVSMGPPFGLQRQATFVKVTRKLFSLRGTQQIEILENGEKNHVVFEATIDANGTAWVKDSVSIPEGYQLESCKVFEKKNGSFITENEVPFDISIEEGEQNVFTLILQQPRTGTFLLRVQAGSDSRLPRKGVLPLIRSSSASGFPYAVIWRGAVQRNGIQVFTDGENPRIDMVQESVAQDSSGSSLGLRVLEKSGSNVWRVELPSNSIQWSYQSEGYTRPSIVSSPQPSFANDTLDPIDAVDSSIKSQLVDVEVLVDERGRIAGVCCIELPMATLEARVRIPSGFRVFEMLLDGRQVQPKAPSHDSALQIWTVPIGNSSWSHELVIVFVAEFDAATMQGEPVSLALPNVAGMSAEHVLWTINYPVGRSVIFAGPGKELSDDMARDIRLKVESKRDDVVDKVTSLRPADVVSRLQEFRLSRQKQVGVAPLEAWVGRVPEMSRGSSIGQHFTSAFLPNNRWRKLIVKPQLNQGAVTIRFADPRLTTVGRSVATLIILIAGALSFWVITNFAGLILEISDRWWPAVAGVAAIGWIVYREPIWPGFMLLVIALGAGFGRLLRIYFHLERHSLAADQPTVTYGESHRVAATSITRVVSNVHESSTITHHIPRRDT
ncbi:hypothetical protein N9B71_00950 [Pirellulales bacterium]|nr:hypothetical protein [Pirellulales bacterium]